MFGHSSVSAFCRSHRCISQRLIFGALVLVAISIASASQLKVTTFAGVSPGYLDGKRSAARFNRPSAVALDQAGNIYVADEVNFVIRKISPTGVVSTLAGKAGTYGIVDGPAKTARFLAPAGLAIDAAGILYVADGLAVRKVAADGSVTTLAGSFNEGSRDGKGSEALFEDLNGIAVSKSGVVYVTDRGNATVRKITAAGVVSTLAGKTHAYGRADGTGGQARFGAYSLQGIAIDASGNLYVADEQNNTIRKISPAGVVKTLAGKAGEPGGLDGKTTAARFLNPNGIALDGRGNLYVADWGSGQIRKITSQGMVSTVAGGAAGYRDGPGFQACFLGPQGLAATADGMLYLADTGNHTIRRIASTGEVTTVAGTNSIGFANGVGAAARFSQPNGVAVDKANNLYVADEMNNVIRKITPAGNVTIFAGIADGAVGHVNGAAAQARFFWPQALAVDSDGNVFVVDTMNNVIRKITPSGRVSTFAGKPAIVTSGLIGGPSPGGSSDGVGAAAQFFAPGGIAVDKANNLYVVDGGNQTIRKITPQGKVTTLAGKAGQSGFADGKGTAARFHFQDMGAFAGIVVDQNGDLLVADAFNGAIRKITPSGVVTTYAGRSGEYGSQDGPRATARFSLLAGLAMDRTGNLFVADIGNSTVRMISRAGSVTTVAGLSGISGVVDGTGSAARFYLVTGLAVDSSGRVFIVDSETNVIRVGVLK